MCSTEEEMAANYEQSANFTKCIKDAYTETRVTPHWIGHSNSFWYRTNVTSGQTRFIFVNAEQGIRRSAFDHDGLVKALADHSIKADATALPFTWIDVSGDGESIKFRMEEKIWHFRSDGTLTEYDGEIDEEELKPMREEKPSDPYGSDAVGSDTVITFINRTKGPISVFWINYDGNAKHYDTVAAGQSSVRPTYVGHVLRVSNSETDESVASFVAQRSDSIAVIKEGITSVTEAIKKSTEDGIKRYETAQPSLQPFVRDYNV